MAKHPQIKQWIKIFFIVSVLLFAISCNNRFQTTKPKSSYDDYDVGTALTTSKKPPTENKADPGIKITYQIKPNTKFHGIYQLNNHLKRKNRYLITALLDYKQVPLTLGKSKAAYHVLNLKPFEEKNLSFSTETIAKGFHDFTILAIKSPFNHSLKKELRVSSDSLVYYPQRAILLADTNKPKPQKFNAKGIVDAANDKLSGVELNEVKPTKVKYLLKKNAAPGKNINYYIHVGNDTQEEQTFAVLVFMDYSQIPINKEKVVFGKLDTHQALAIPTNLTAPSKKGTHELFALKINNPFLTEKQREKKDDQILSSIRTAIIVK